MLPQNDTLVLVQQMKGGKYIVYSIITTLLEETALVAVVLWLLPRFRINIPLWGLILMMVTLGAYDYVTYRLGKESLDKKPIVSPDIGSRGKATTSLIPRGYVRVDNELWQASSSSTVNAGEEVIIEGIDGLTLLVAPPDNSNKAEIDKAREKGYPY